MSDLYFGLKGMPERIQKPRNNGLSMVMVMQLLQQLMQVVLLLQLLVLM